MGIVAGAAVDGAGADSNEVVDAVYDDKALSIDSLMASVNSASSPPSHLSPPSEVGPGFGAAAAPFEVDDGAAEDKDLLFLLFSLAAEEGAGAAADAVVFSLSLPLVPPVALDAPSAMVLAPALEVPTVPPMSL